MLTENTNQFKAALYEKNAELGVKTKENFGEFVENTQKGLMKTKEGATKLV